MKVLLQRQGNIPQLPLLVWDDDEVAEAVLDNKKSLDTIPSFLKEAPALGGVYVLFSSLDLMVFVCLWY